MCLNYLTKLREYILTNYKGITRNLAFLEKYYPISYPPILHLEGSDCHFTWTLTFVRNYECHLYQVFNITTIIKSHHNP